MQNNNSKFKILNWPLLFLAFSFAFYTPAHAAVSQLVFSTNPQTVAPGAISDKLTVSSGEAPGETSDLTLNSSSASGEFVNESGEPVRPTWNSNWANRTFYYRDTTAGTYTITATLTTRVSQQSWSATQTITVGAGSSGDGNENDDNDTTTTTTTQNNSNSSDSSGDSASSAHASPTPISQTAPSEPFKIGAGRSRLASIHSPVIFQIESTGATAGSVRYQWSFGDGGSAVGDKVSHTYLFPGEYNVVVNALGRDQVEAVTRTTVSVVDQTPTLGQVSADRVEIVNKSTRELNLGGWQIAQGGRSFVFPPDTIIATGKRLIVPAVLLGFSPNPSSSITLFFPDQTVALSSQSLEALNQSVVELSGKLAMLKTKTKIKTITPTLVPVPRPTTTPEIVSTPTTPPPVAAVATIPVPKAPGLFTRIKRWFSQ